MRLSILGSLVFAIVFPACNTLTGINDYASQSVIAVSDAETGAETAREDTREVDGEVERRDAADAGSEALEPDTAPTVDTSPEAPCPTHHAGPDGKTYVYCAPLGVPGDPSTYSVPMAVAARSATITGSGSGGPLACGGGEAATFTVAGEVACTSWMYSGPDAGHWRTYSSGCICPSVGDPTWD